MTNAAAVTDMEILAAGDPDPFALRHGQAVPPAGLDGEAALIPIAEITDEQGHEVGAGGTARKICRGPQGHYHVIDIGPDACRVVGAPVTFSTASDIAAAILAGNQRIATAPGVLNLLALAFLAARAEASKRRFREKSVSPGVSPDAAAAPVSPPAPLAPTGAVASASQHGLPAGAQSGAHDAERAA